MHGDFSRMNFRPEKQYRAVLAQQGRVQLDADSNEQAEIDDYRLRALVVDLVGRHAGPAGRPGDDVRPGFSLNLELGDQPDLVIGPGRYYVDGIRVEAARPVPATGVGGTPANSDAPNWSYWNQPDAWPDPEQDDDLLPATPYLAYLRVAERLVTAVQDPDLLERALGAALPDTTARIKVVWQLAAVPEADLPFDSQDRGAPALRQVFDTWAQQRSGDGTLAMRTSVAAPSTDPCIVRPSSQYRGPENQLYRVEIYSVDGKNPTFVWSRENGSVTAPLAAVEGEWVTLTAPGRDDKLGLEVGDWVEPVDDVSLSRAGREPLLQVLELDPSVRRVKLSGEAGVDPDRHAFLRRWDQRAARGAALVDGAVPVTPGDWQDLEDGVQVWFAEGGSFRSGDYWVSAARTIGGSLDWPTDEQDRPLLLPPRGPVVHYAPLAWVSGDALTDLREAFASLNQPIEAVADSTA
jgi:hypothetical protein